MTLPWLYIKKLVKRFEVDEIVVTKEYKEECRLRGANR